MERKKIGAFSIFEHLGSGSFGSVYKAFKNTKEDEYYAVKVISKKSCFQSKKMQQLIKNEINVMTRVKHKNVIRLIQYMESKSNFYLVMMFCNQGDLQLKL